jgi:hypothetical protein
MATIVSRTRTAPAAVHPSDLTPWLEVKVFALEKFRNAIAVKLGGSAAKGAMGTDVDAGDA